MKQNTFYLLTGVVGLIEVLVFYLSVELSSPLLVTAAVIAGIVCLYLARQRVSDRIVDERAALITQKAAMATFSVFWVVFFATSLGSAVMGLGAPKFPPHPFHGGGPDIPNMTPEVPADSHGMPGLPNDGLLRLGFMGYMQLTLLFLMFFLYVAFRTYYARKYGEWETDEEQG